MSKGLVTTYAEELGVWVAFQHIRDFGWDRSYLDDISGPAGHVH
jgi:hypothetical protein